MNEFELGQDALFSIKESPAKGRHAVANRTIPIGRAILQADPFASVLYGDQYSLRCSRCMMTGNPLMRCQTTKLLRFCSKECQRYAWNHLTLKHEMKALAASPRAPPPTCYLAAKVLWRRLQQTKDSWSHYWDSSAAVDSLKSHWECLDDDRKETFVQMAVVSRDFALHGIEDSQADMLPGLREVADLIGRLSCNAHTICDEELRPIGVGLYPLGAMLNHNCDPNCIQFFGTNGRIDFRTCREVNEGEELTIAYIDLAATMQEKREALAYSYRFDLVIDNHPPVNLSAFKTGRSCPFRPQPLSEITFFIADPTGEKEVRCFSLVYSNSSRPPWPHDENVDLDLSGFINEGTHSSGGVMVNTASVDRRSWELDDASSEGTQTDKEIEIEVIMWGDWCSHSSSDSLAKDVAAACLLLSKVSKARHRSGSLRQALALIAKLPMALHPHHLLRMRINAALLKALIDGGVEWEHALEVARDLAPTYQIVYPKNSLNIILHNAMLAKLELLVGDPVKAADAAHNALSSWSQICPPRSFLLTRENGIQDQIQQTLIECQGLQLG